MRDQLSVLGKQGLTDPRAYAVCAHDQIELPSAPIGEVHEHFPGSVVFRNSLGGQVASRTRAAHGLEQDAVKVSPIERPSSELTVATIDGPQVADGTPRETVKDD